jgi:hypothetical protein
MRYMTIGSNSRSARKVSVLSLGAMQFGTVTDEATSFAILDRYVAAGCPSPASRCPLVAAPIGWVLLSQL